MPGIGRDGIGVGHPPLEKPEGTVAFLAMIGAVGLGRTLGTTFARRLDPVAKQAPSEWFYLTKKRSSRWPSGAGAAHSR